MNAERLLRLAEHLETVVPPERFDMGIFACVGRLDCGSEGCALGHACDIPEFRKAGLSIDWGEGDSRGIRYGDVSFGGDENLSAAMKFFDISEGAALHLFMPEDDTDLEEYVAPESPTPLDVAARIRHFVTMSEQAGVEYTP